MIFKGLWLLFLAPFAGGLVAWFSNKNNAIPVKLFLAFSGSYLISVCLTGMVPHVFEHSHNAGYWMLGGFFFQLFLERLTQGVEHGHIHNHLKTPLTLFAGLSLHSFLEGIPVAGALTGESSELAKSLMYGIALHEIPAAFTLILILKQWGKVGKMLPILLILYSSMAILGAYSGAFLSEVGNDAQHISDYAMAFVSGTFMHIATTILFENSENHRFSPIKIAAIILGASLALFTVSH